MKYFKKAHLRQYDNEKRNFDDYSTLYTFNIHSRKVNYATPTIYFIFEILHRTQQNKIESLGKFFKVKLFILAKWVKKKRMLMLHFEV